MSDASAVRTPQDFALEFASYLATSAERYIAAVNSLESARDASAECDIPADWAEIEATEAYSRLQSDIYEFRKRLARCNPLNTPSAIPSEAG